MKNEIRGLKELKITRAYWEKFLWNVTRTASVRASRIRSFTIEEVGIETSPTHSAGYVVIGWFSDTESFNLGVLPALDEAREFIEKIHKQIEEVEL